MSANIWQIIGAVLIVIGVAGARGWVFERFRR